MKQKKKKQQIQQCWQRIAVSGWLWLCPPLEDFCSYESKSKCKCDADPQELAFTLACTPQSTLCLWHLANSNNVCSDTATVEIVYTKRFAFPMWSELTTFVIYRFLMYEIQICILTLLISWTTEQFSYHLCASISS